jgi:Tol biopolymer transport system component
MILLSLVGGICIAAEESDYQVVAIQDSQPVWSPNGKQIAFISNRNLPAGAPADSKNLWVVNVDGTNLRQLTSSGVNNNPSWSPDGKQIAFQSDRQLLTVDIATGRFTEITDGVKASFAPDWNPKDAIQIVCALQTFIKEDNDLLILNPHTSMSRDSGRKNVRSREGSDDRPRWSRDGKHIAFIGEVIDKVSRAHKWYLMTIMPDGTRLKTYCELPKDASRPSWMLNDDAIVIDGGGICNLATGKVTSLFGENIKDPDVSPDGRRVVFCDSVRGDADQYIYVSKIDGSDKTQITSPPSVDTTETENAE